MTDLNYINGKSRKHQFNQKCLNDKFNNLNDNNLRNINESIDLENDKSTFNKIDKKLIEINVQNTSFNFMNSIDHLINHLDDLSIDSNYDDQFFSTNNQYFVNQINRLDMKNKEKKESTNDESINSSTTIDDLNNKQINRQKSNKSIINQNDKLNLDNQLNNDDNKIENKDQLSPSKESNKRTELEFSTSIGQLTNENNYVHIQNDTTFQINDEEVSVSVVLNYCKNYVFKTFFRLVSIVGLRPLFGQNTLFSLSRLPLIGCFLSSINILYTIFVLLIILLGYLLQATSCYRQDGLPTFVKVDEQQKNNNTSTKQLDQIQSNNDNPTNLSVDLDGFNETINRYDYLNKDLSSRFNYDDNNYGKDYSNIYDVELKNGHFQLNKLNLFDNEFKKLKKDIDYQSNKENRNSSSLICSGNLFTMFLLPDILHLSAYLFTIYLMRASEIEKTEHLLEKSFLQASQTNGWLIAHRKLVQKLRFFLYLAFFWLIISILNHLLHVIFQTVHFTILYQIAIFFHKPILVTKLHTPLLVFTVITLIVKDLVCSVIIASYAIHCELNISFIQCLCRSLREKKIDLQEFVKGIEEARKFVHYLNNQQSFAVSLLTISISSQLLQAFYKLFQQLFNNQSSLITFILVSVSAILWLSKLLTPLIQASRLSSTCNELRYIGLELRARPFGYTNTPQNDLDSIVIYTGNLRLKGKILHCPIKKSMLFASLAIIIVIILFLGQINYF